MSGKRHFWPFALPIPLILIAILLALYVTALWLTPLPLKIVDSDHSGLVSLAEALDALDVGHRQRDTQPGCIEYFWYKDGMTAYVDCRKSTTF